MPTLGRADEPGAVEPVLGVDVRSTAKGQLEQPWVVADLTGRDQVRALLGVVFGVDVRAGTDQHAGRVDVVSVRRAHQSGGSTIIAGKRAGAGGQQPARLRGVASGGRFDQQPINLGAPRRGWRNWRRGPGRPRRG